MRISIEEIGTDEDEEIIIRCRQINQEILELYQQIKKNQNCIAAAYGEEIYRLPIRDIFYF
ncbi:MAG: LytTR family transcriptional regulator, partial [Lachnospiraceae bacterium]|nr:LytTR family transcriptional regulator [Lachnospiraceae bacterium]